MFEIIMSKIFSNDLIGGAFILSIFTSCLYYFKNVPKNLFLLMKKKIVYSTYFKQTEDIYDVFEKWLTKNHLKKYRITETTSNTLGNQLSLKYTQFSDSFIINYKGYFLHVHKHREKLDHTDNFYTAYLNSYTIRGIMCKNIIIELLETCAKQHNKNSIQNYIYYNGMAQWNNYGSITEFKDRHNVFINKDTENKIFNTIDNFRSSDLFYSRNKINHRLGILLHGKPGNGKTSIIQSIAKHYKKNIFILTFFKGMSDNNLLDIMSRINPGAIVVLEDVDCIFKDARSLNGDNLNFNTLLNCMDGLVAKKGIITILTTNKPLKLDKALLRPGRIDLQIEIKNPDLDTVSRYYKQMFDSDLNIKELKVSRSMAKIQNIVLSNLNDKDRVRKLIGGV